MAKPTAALIRDWSQVDFGALGFEQDSALQRLVDRAVAFVYAYTGAAWDDVGVFDRVLALEPLGLNAVQLLTEMLAFRAQEDVPETLSDFDLIQSFSAGGYSETRRDPRQSAQIGIAQLVILQSALWPLMDEDHQDQWIRLLGGPNAPAFATTEVNWNAGSSYGSMPGDFGASTPADNYPLGSLPADPWPPPS